MKHSRSSIFIHLLTAIVISFCVERVFSISSYSLEKATTKIKSVKASSNFVPIMGSEEFLSSSNTLFKNRVNLDMWHGNQHLIFKQDKSLSFTLEQSKKSRVELIIGRFVVVLRANQKALAYEKEKGFNSKREVDLTVKKENHIKFQDKKLLVNNREVPGVRGSSLEIRIMGSEKVSLSSIVIDEKPVKLRPTFSVLTFLSSLLPSFLLFMFLGALKGAMAGILLSAISIACFLSYIYSFQERYSFDFFQENSEEELLIKKEKERVKDLLSKNKSSILFIGSSQTFGEGASSIEKRWTDLYCAKMKLKNCLNIGIRSAVSQTFLSLKKDIGESRPEKIFFVLSHNDSDVDSHKKNIDALFKDWLSLGIEVVIVLEPNIYSLIELSPLHYNLKKLGWKYGFKVLNPIDKFKKRSGEAGIWWDEVHFTDEGHRLMTDALIFP